MESGGYPPGAQFDSSAPYNQVELSEEEVEVTISITLSKTVKVKVNDYTTEVDGDDDGRRYISYNFSNCDLYRAVEDQVVLPQDLAKYTERMFEHDVDLKAAGMPRYLKDAINDCKYWNVDDYEVILEQ